MSHAIWSPTLERSRNLDFAYAVQQELVLIAIEQMPNVDFGLFIRPFSQRVWFSIVCILAVIATFLFSKLSDDFSHARHICTLTVMLLFVLLQSFFGGALTMFFASEHPVPFNDVRGAMKAYPDWRLHFLEGECHL